MVRIVLDLLKKGRKIMKCRLIGVDAQKVFFKEQYTLMRCACSIIHGNCSYVQFSAQVSMQAGTFEK